MIEIIIITITIIIINDDNNNNNNNNNNVKSLAPIFVFSKFLYDKER